MPTNRETDRNYWLLKTEPTTFSFDDLWNAPRRTTSWDGVRNFQARNMLRDQIKEGDLAFIYHSSTDPTGIVGIAEVVRSGYPDATAFDPKDSHYDAKSRKDSPTWYVVDVKAVKKFREIVTLERMRGMKGLEGMVLLKKGSRLSVQPVSPAEWAVIVAAAQG
ncbi:MAG TPA: EVE domain-containing protein [Gemmatimonadaceae bacterium]|nr:EVE domain-containing protein [Gemmatimonadaceae bacterium]